MFRVDVDGEALLLELKRGDSPAAFTLRGSSEQKGQASIEEVTPGVFSILLGNRSLQVHIAPRAQGFEAWTQGRRYFISLSDARDQSDGARQADSKGPVELRAQMPGKIIKLLVIEGAAVASGDGLIVVEAMKMQNEVKAPKDGTLTRIHVEEGATVSAGDALVTVE